MTRLKGCLLSLLKAVGVFILLLLAAYTGLNMYASAKLDRELTTLKASGAKLSIDEVMPKASPDTNAAPLYQTAFDAMRVSNEDDLVCANLQAALQPKGEALYASPPPELLTRSRLVLQQNAEALAWVRKAVKMPECVFPVDWSAGPSVQLPHYAKMRKVARLLGTAMVISAIDGNSDEVVQECVTCLDVGDAAGSDPILIATLVRIAIDAIALRAMDRAMRTTTLSPAQCRALAERLAKIEFTKSMARAMEGERAMGLVAFDMLAKHRVSLKELSESEARVPSLRVFSLPANLKLDEAFYLRFMGEQMRDAARPWRDVGDTSKRLEGELRVFPANLCVLTHILVPVFSRAALKRDTIQAQIGMAQVVLGLQAYKDETGRYPSSLAELRAKANWEVPPDPFSGQDFVYKPQGATYLLYSVGANLKDDGGKVEHNDFSGEKGDIVWGR